MDVDDEDDDDEEGDEDDDDEVDDEEEEEGEVGLEYLAKDDISVSAPFSWAWCVC